MSLLSFMIWFPVLGASLILAPFAARRVQVARSIALFVAIVNLLVCIPVYFGFDPSSYKMQLQEDHLWISAFQIHYALGVDGISLVMIMLTNFTGFLVILAGCHSIQKRVAQYMAAFLVMQGMMIGVFAATDAILFYVFWEGMLIPMYLSIGIWGSANRSYASIKFFLYTFLGSILMFVALLYLHSQTSSFNISDFYGLRLPNSIQLLVFLAFLLAFAVKVPMWPVHTWLPDAHTEAPSGGSVVLAALMLKLGVYGFLRFSMPIVPNACNLMSTFMVVLSLIAVVYIGLVAMVQTDMKKLIAYSSIAHMGFATLGCFMVYQILTKTELPSIAYMSLEGATFQMIAHAFGSGAMFLGVGMLADRHPEHSRNIADYGGVAKIMPLFAAFYMVFAMSNVGLPGTAGFVGEFMIIMSSFHASFLVGIIAATTLVLSVAYTLWMYLRVFFLDVSQPAVAKMRDLHWIEFINYSLLLVAVFVLGFYPNVVLHLLHATIRHLLIVSMPMAAV